MFINIIKVLILIFFLSIKPLYSKNTNNTEFNPKNLSNYFSALVSLENQHNKDSLKFFNSSKFLINFHEPYLKNYIDSLVLEGKINKAANELKFVSNKGMINFFDAYLILFLDAIKKEKTNDAKEYLDKILNLRDKQPFESVIAESLNDFLYVFKKKKKKKLNKELGDLGFINLTFQNCYLEDNKTGSYFENLFDKTQLDYSRYAYFYVNHLISNGEYKKAKSITDSIDVINSNLLILQTKNWINTKKYKQIVKLFSCKNENDILSEFFYLIASIYSSEEEYKKSNFYVRISNFLNPKFKFNLTLISENFFINKKYTQSKAVMKNFNKRDGVYNWYKIKKNTQIILKQKGTKEASNYLKTNFEAGFYPGAAGRVGYETYMGKAKADCYNLIFGNMGPEVLNWVVKKPTFDLRSFLYIAQVDQDPGVVFVSKKNKKLKTKNMTKFKINYKPKGRATETYRHVSVVGYYDREGIKNVGMTVVVPDRVSDKDLGIRRFSYENIKSLEVEVAQ